MTRPRLLSAILVLMLSMLAPSTFASEYLYNRISLQDGLSQGNVTCIARDNRGFLWIGTRFGLNRYDFESVKQYFHDPANEDNSLPDNHIQNLFVDNHGVLWVACERGLAHYDERSDSFIPAKRVDGRGINVRSFIDEDDGFLMGSGGEFYFYNYITKDITQLTTTGGSTYYYTDIHRWASGYYIVATRWDGLWILDRRNQTLSRLPGVDERRIMACTIDSHGLLWVSPYGEGLFVYDRSGKRTQPLLRSNSALSEDIILDIAEHDGKMWIATDGGGVAVYDPSEHKFVDGMGLSSLRSLGSVTTLVSDGMGNLYAGTVRDGAIAVRTGAMRTFNGWGNENWAAITSLLREDNNTLWIGDDGNGVFRHNEGSDRFEQIKSTRDFKITSIEALNSNELLVCTFGRGIYVMDKASGRLMKPAQALVDLYEDSRKRAITMRLRKLSDGNIAIITNEINIYNIDKQTITPAQHPADYKGGRGGMTPIHNHGNRLLCLDGRNISEYDQVTKEHSTIFTLPEKTNAYCATFDGLNTIYVGTDNGVVAIDISDGKTSRLPGFESMRINSIALDGHDRLWIGTNRSVFLKTLSTGNLIAFGHSDGVTPNEYLPNAVAVSDSRLYFGGANGLLRIDCDDVDAIMATYNTPELNLADITVDGVSAYSEIENGKLKVAPGHNSLKISLIDNGSSSMRDILFRYHIRQGKSERTIDTYSRALELNFLEGGKDYEILASSSRPDGSWSHPHKLATIAMLSPWYKSTWAMACLLMIALGCFGVWEYQRNQKREGKIKNTLDKMHNKALENEVAFLVNANYALRTPLTLIYAPVKLLIEQLRGKGQDNESLPQLENIYQNTKRMRDTLDMVLELHNEASASKITRTTHDISRSIKDAISARHDEIKAKNLTVSYLPTQEIFPAIYDRDRLGKVLDSLLRNAIQRSSDHASISIHAFETDGMVKVSISDTGAKLDEEALSGLFSKYFNDDNANFGNSLEFAYVKNIIESQNGHIGAENNSDRPGLTVWFEYPLADTQVAEDYLHRRKHNLPAPTAPVDVVANIDTSQLSAIVVEEDSELCLFIAHQLTPYFGHVLHAFNGKDALLMIHQNLPDIVITSVMLPQKSGLELCRDIKSSHETSHIPVILLTSIKDSSMIESGYGVGADSYIAKPFDLAILLTRCRNLLRNRSVMRERYADRPKTQTPQRNMRNADESLILKIDKIITDNISDPDFGVDMIVEKLALSRSALYTKFKEITGMSIGSYIAVQRLNRAKELLADQGLAISEIAEVLGFSSQRYFSTFFKERTGMSPSAFRASLAHN